MKKVSLMAMMIGVMVFGICACTGGRNTDTPVSYADVSAMNADALKAYEEGRFEDSLKKYAEAIKANPLDMDARVGTVRCEISLEDYGMAQSNLSAAFQVDPKEEVLYDLYIELSEKSNNNFFARTAADLAKIYQVQSFLDRMPSPPEIQIPEGEYDHRLDVEINGPDGADIYVVEKKDNKTEGTYLYKMPFTVTGGVTDLEVYCMKDGIPSDAVKVRYVCEYEPKEVSFEDPVFEKMVRAVIGRETGSITDIECEEVDELQFSAIHSLVSDYDEYKKMKIYTLNDLYWFPNLKYLYLEDQEMIADFSPMAQCRKLYLLSVSDCGISDASFASDISNLRYFRAENNRIADLSPLSKCKNLYGLDINGNPVSDLSSLKELDMGDLSVDASQLQNGAVLESWNNLLSLSVYGCGNHDCGFLGDLTQLENLYIYAWSENSHNHQDESPIGDISFLQRLTNLTYLRLNGLSDYSQMGIIGNLSNLDYLYFSTLDYSLEPPENLLNELQKSLPNCEIDY